MSNYAFPAAGKVNSSFKISLGISWAFVNIYIFGQESAPQVDICKLSTGWRAALPVQTTLSDVELGQEVPWDHDVRHLVIREVNVERSPILAEYYQFMSKYAFFSLNVFCTQPTFTMRRKLVFFSYPKHKCVHLFGAHSWYDPVLGSRNT